MSKKKRLLKTGDRPLVISGTGLPPTLQKVKDYLDALSVDEVRTTRQIAQDLGISLYTIHNEMYLLGEQYRDHCESQKFYSYGNPKTIKAWREGEYDDGQPDEEE